MSGLIPLGFMPGISQNAGAGAPGIPRVSCSLGRGNADATWGERYSHDQLRRPPNQVSNRFRRLDRNDCQEARLLPYSDACERNKQPILTVLVDYVAPGSRLLEIGSGTGQHAVHFARQLPAVRWQPSDRLEYLDGLARRIALEGPVNLCEAVELDVERSDHWPAPGQFDAVFSANTLHIMSWPAVQALFSLAGRVLPSTPSTRLMVYGPFRYGGRCTTPSNEAFDEMLRARDPASGLRDFEAVHALAAQESFVLLADRAMPANNQMLVWGR